MNTREFVGVCALGLAIGISAGIADTLQDAHGPQFSCAQVAAAKFYLLKGEWPEGFGTDDDADVIRLVHEGKNIRRLEASCRPYSWEDREIPKL